MNVQRMHKCGMTMSHLDSTESALCWLMEEWPSDISPVCKQTLCCWRLIHEYLSDQWRIYFTYASCIFQKQKTSLLFFYSVNSVGYSSFFYCCVINNANTGACHFRLLLEHILRSHWIHLSVSHVPNTFTP